MQPSPIRILLVDDDELVRLSLQQIIEADSGLAVVGQAEDGQSAVKAYFRLRPDLVLMDIRMQPVDGLVAGETILSKEPQAKILYLTTFADDSYIIRALRMGARGYILKQDYASIVEALKAVYRNQNVYGDPVMSKMPQLLSQNPDPDFSSHGLTEREVQITRAVADGLSNREIAHELNLGEGTVRNHLSVILDKLKLRDRTQLAIFYLKTHRMN